MSRANIHIIQADITQLEVDAIVNAANYTLLGGGGVDGAIHRAAGPELKDYCRTLGGCQTGEVKVTPGFALAANYVFHTVGPIYGQEEGREEQLLTACYANAIQRAQEYGLKSLAIPAISTGSFGYPLEEAARVAVRAGLNALSHGVESLDDLYFVVRSDSSLAAFRSALAEVS